MIPDSHFAANVNGEFLSTINWSQYQAQRPARVSTADREEKLLTRKRAAEEQLKRCAAVRCCE